MKIIALDFETGGVKPDYHAPTNLGVAVMEDGNVIETREWIYLRMDNTEPKFKRRSYDVAALEVSGTSWKAIKEGTHERNVLKEFREFVKKHDAGLDVIVSHNATFDQAFFADWLFRCGDFNRDAQAYLPERSPLGGAWQCTMRMAQGILGLSDYRLDTVAAAFGLARTGTLHGASEDAVLAGSIYFGLLAKIAGRN